MEQNKNFCKECGHPNWHHFFTWLDEITSLFLPSLEIPRKIETVFNIILDRILSTLKIVKFRSDFNASNIQLRSFCFIEEMKKRGATFKAMQSPFGYNNYFKMKVGKKTFRFQTLPTKKLMSQKTKKIVGDKKLSKIYSQKGGFPVAKSQSFWFWQKRKAIQFGKKIGFPLVVKPRAGSVSRHVTTNIQNEKQLKKAVRCAVNYSPAFIIERFISKAHVYRATVIDFDFVVCVKQIPANVIGDGVSTIRQLIDRKNNSPNRGEANQKQFTLYRITENETTKKILMKKGYDHNTVLEKEEILYLQKDSFLKLGGDLVEVSPSVHKDNLELFSRLARFFDIRLTGIDFIAGDIAISWKKQPCAVLELNSTPCIELHHFPSFGVPTNPAKALANTFFKYYL